MGGRFKGERTYVYLRLIHVDVWQKPAQYCKAIIFQLKQKKNCLIIDYWPNYTSTRKDLNEENLILTFKKSGGKKKNQEEKTDKQQKWQYNVVSTTIGGAGVHAFIHFLTTYSVPISGGTVVKMT